MSRRIRIASILAFAMGLVAFLTRKDVPSGAGIPDQRSDSNRDPEENGSGILGPKSLAYVADLAAESFKRQVDLDESVWRSLPFFAATYAFVAALAGHAATDMPPPTCGWYAGASHLLLLLSVGSLAWALRWFWTVLRPREYEYPADDAAILHYAESIAEYHSSLGVDRSELDGKVDVEMRRFMIDQYGSAARTNFAHNGEKMKARGRVLLFILIGFVLAFAAEALIYTHKGIYGS